MIAPTAIINGLGQTIGIDPIKVFWMRGYFLHHQTLGSWNYW